MLAANKILWTANALRLKALGVEISMPGYVGPTMSLIGRGNLKVGKRVRIWPGARIELYSDASLTIEDEVSIGPYSHITIASDLTIGAKSTFSGANVITNISHSLSEMDKHPLERPWSVEPVMLGQRLFVGHGAKVLPGAKLADGCVVGANAVVGKLDAAENSVVVGMPAKVIRTVE